VKLRIRYSLRVLFICLSAFAIWLGVRTSAAMHQRRAIATITNAGGLSYFNWQLQPIYDAEGNVDYFKVIRDPSAIPAPKWVRQLVGDEFFQHVVKVHIHPDKVNDEIISVMGNLPKLNSIDLSWEQTDPDDWPKLTRRQLDELERRVQSACPQASVWSPGL